MQQELIEMLEETIQYVEVWNAHDQGIIDKAEALVEKAKKSAKEPAVPQGEPVYQLARATGPVADAWIDVAKDVYDDAGFHPSDFKRRILYATPAATSQPVTLTDEQWLEYLLRNAPKDVLSMFAVIGCSTQTQGRWIPLAQGFKAIRFIERAIIAALREKEQVK